ncbi:MAG: hypothetical protein NTZ55_05705 [Candidatus Roizmanbacteria bacterium]|nr:hypothetical protein [Candidatus Roizmanbacteria bacterium]
MKSDQVDYNFQQDAWYSPKLIIILFNKLFRKYGSNIYKSQFKRALEMFNAAIALLGVYELDEGNKYWLQSNNQTSSPDVMAVQEAEIPGEKVTLMISQMEMVEFQQNYPNNNIIDFLKHTKLSPHKAYDDKTLIVVMINRKVQLNRAIIATELQKLKPRSTIYILGKILEKPASWFMIFSPYPRPTTVVQFDFSKTAQKYSIPDNIRLFKGANDKIVYVKGEKEIIKLSNVFSFDEKKVEKYSI